MPASDSPAIIVARYLKSNNYTETYEAFIDEVGLPYDAGSVGPGDLTLETLLDEKRTFDISVKFEKLGVEEVSNQWSLPAPSTALEISALPAASNILSTRVDELEYEEGKSISSLVVSTADRRLHILDARNNILQASLPGLHDSPVLSSSAFQRKYLLTCSMSGRLHMNDLNGNSLSKRSDHSKYAVKVTTLEDDPDAPIIATAGWDNKIHLYRPDVRSGDVQFGEPKATIPLQTKPEAILFVRHPENDQPVLLASRTDSNFIFYYTVEDEPRLLGRQNLAPHSNAWVAFTPSSLELCPTDPTVLAVGTSSVPHMKLLLVKLLFPPWEAQAPRPPPLSLRASLLDEPATETQASQARAELAIADREAVAIQIHCTTMAPQTAYSTPAVAWRPDGSGVWVNGDDGAVRGIEASTGKIVSTLKGHEPGSKVRCLWAGHVKTEDGGEKEILVSGGFDQKLIVWNV